MYVLHEGSWLGTQLYAPTPKTTVIFVRKATLEWTGQYSIVLSVRYFLWREIHFPSRDNTLSWLLAFTGIIPNVTIPNIDTSRIQEAWTT